MGNRLIIELLALERGKSYGYQEYVLNFLNYLYLNIEELHYKNVVIWCKETEKQIFIPFEDKFKIEGFKISGYFQRHWLQTWLPFKYKLGARDLLFSPGNISGVIKCCPEILTIHDLLFKRKKWLPSTIMRWQREILIPNSIRKADKIVAISNFTKHDLEHYYPQSKGKIDVIYNSFNFKKFIEDEEINIDGDFFLAISTNYDYKNQKIILEAFEKYVEVSGDKLLVVIGNINPSSEAGLYYSNMQIKVKERICWKAHLTDSQLASLYKTASCFISASKFEGLGMPVVEAMSFGLPVLLSDIPPHREVSLNKGEYFDPNDAVGLSKKMLEMDFGKKDYNYDIRRIFSEENTSAKYIALINSFGDR